jgi:hypothetical protein
MIRTSSWESLGCGAKKSPCCERLRDVRGLATSESPKSHDFQPLQPMTP